jgi:hypothetical protein
MQKTTRTIIRQLGVNATDSLTASIYCPFQPDLVRVRCYNASDQLVVQTTVTSTLPLETIDGVIGAIVGDVETAGVVIDTSFQCVNPISGDYTFNFSENVDGVIVIILEFIKN